MKPVTLLSLCAGACLVLAAAQLKFGSGIPSEEALMQTAPDPSKLPWPVIKLGAAVGRFVELLSTWVNPPGFQMMQLTSVAPFKATTIKTLAELGVADLLVNGPRTSQEVAAALGNPGSSDALFRLLQMSTASGVFADDGPLKGAHTRFRNNKMSILLRNDHPNSMRHILIHLAVDGDAAWSKLTDGVRTGEMPFGLAHGMGLWQYFKEKPHRQWLRKIS